MDNASTDGTAEYLADQPDVSLWSTAASYRRSTFGVDWMNWLCRRHAHGHWTLTVDPDEWNAFWQDDRNARFEIAIAFLGDSRPLLVSSFGAAIVDTAAAEALVSCGCYWN